MTQRGGAATPSSVLVVVLEKFVLKGPKASAGVLTPGGIPKYAAHPVGGVRFEGLPEGMNLAPLQGDHEGGRGSRGQNPGLRPLVPSGQIFEDEDSLPAIVPLIDYASKETQRTTAGRRARGRTNLRKLNRAIHPRRICVICG
jgi:hypothetical protein